MKAKSTLNDNTLIDCINEVNKYCSYLSRMYEYYFPPLKTGNVTAITVYLVENLQRLDAPSLCTNMRIVANIIDLSNFKQMQPEEKSLYIIDLCQKCMLSLVREMKWNTEPFEYTYDKIIRVNSYFREHWKNAKWSPDKQRKAHIYFEDDFEKNGIFVDFTDKRGNLLKRIGFAPNSDQIFSNSISEPQWQDNTHVKIKRSFGTGFSETSDYWLIDTDGSVEYHSPRAENIDSNPQGLFDLGILLWEGKAVFQNKKQGLTLIKKSAQLNYKHAKLWLEKNVTK